MTQNDIFNAWYDEIVSKRFPNAREMAEEMQELIDRADDFLEEIDL